MPTNLRSSLFISEITNTSVLDTLQKALLATLLVVLRRSSVTPAALRGTLTRLACSDVRRFPLNSSHNRVHMVCAGGLCAGLKTSTGAVWTKH